MTKTHAIIDADHILYMCLHGIKKLDENGEPIKEDGRFVYDPKPLVQAIAEADSYIESILEKTNAFFYIGFIGGSSQSRKEINPTYKSNRTKDRPENFTALLLHLVEKWNIYHVTDAETDDYVATYLKANPKSFTISPDKDINSLEGLHYNPKKDEWEDVSKDRARYFFWKSMITGDSSDGVNFCPYPSKRGNLNSEPVGNPVLNCKMFFA